MIPKLRSLSCSLLAVSAMVAGCAYNTPDAPTVTVPAPSTAPASIRTTASSRSDYTTAVLATVLTADGKFVAGIPIGFSTANGTVSVSQAVTDANGSATTIVNTPANTTVTVTIGALTTTVQVQGASAPNTGAPPPPIITPPPSPAVPTAIINVASTGTAGAPVPFGVSAPTLGQTWTWSFGDGTSAQTTAFSTIHTYATPGVYTATVSAPGVNSGSAVIVITNPASSAAPTLVVTITCTATVHTTPVVCNVSAVAYGTTTIPSASVTATSWDWGDSTGVTAGIVGTHTYATAGTYTIVTTVTATTVDGAKTVTVVKAISVT